MKLNRREFLKFLGTVSAGAVLAGVGGKGEEEAEGEILSTSSSSTPTSAPSSSSHELLSEEHPDFQPSRPQKPRYIAVLGWLEGSEYNNVILSEDAIRLILWGLNDGALFDVPGKKRHSIGTVRVDGGTVYCYTDHDLSGKRPALEIVAHTTALENGKILVTSVKKCALFITDDDNGNAFYKVINA